MACSWAIAPVCAQDISQIAKSDPLIITGSIGTNNTYFHSSAGLGYMSPLSNSFFANLNFNIYGFSMPFSIYFSNDNLNFNYPQFSFNLSPSYKNFTAHIGQSSMPFSQYVLNMSFNGVGLEWRDKQFRASAFYGVLRRAVNDNPDDPTARIPQYRRYGWGISAGYSKGGNSIDLYFLRAYDSESSIDERWRTRVRPQENLVLGLKGQLSYKNFLSLAANVATSAFTADRESQQVMTDEARRFDKIFETRYTSRLRFAGDATLGLTLKGFNASIFYKSPVVTPLKIRLTEGEPGSVALVDGLTFRIEAASGEEGAKSIVGQTINAYNHTLKARDIKVRLVGKIIVNKD